jgi:hypothetical protein
MVATCTIYDDIGGTDNDPAVTPIAVTNLRYKEADNNTQDLNNPVTIPAAGTKWSFWKHNFAAFTGTFTQIDNINLWVNTFNWTGVTLWIDDNLAGLTHVSGGGAGADDGYDVADGLNNLNTHTHITTPVNHGSTHTSSGTAKPIDIDEAGGVIDAAGEESNYWVTAIEVGTTAVAGTQTARTENLEYDEI